MRSLVSRWSWSFVVLCSVVSLALVGCNSDSGGGGGGGGVPDSGTTPTGPHITIQNYAFSPVDLTVDAGTTIAIINMDTMAHTVTSEASDDAFTPGGVAGVSFDSGQVQPAGGSDPYGYVRAAAATGSITIPASAPSGTVIPYFCTNHTSTMATPNGHITVR